LADFIRKILPGFSKSAVGKIGTKLIVSKVERDGNKGAVVLEFSPYFNESPDGMDKRVCPCHPAAEDCLSSAGSVSPVCVRDFLFFWSFGKEGIVKWGI
jgi:hypothetical protein